MSKDIQPETIKAVGNIAKGFHEKASPVSSDPTYDFDEIEYTLANCIRITLNVEEYTTEVNVGNGKWVPIVDYVKAFLKHQQRLVVEAEKKARLDLIDYFDYFDQVPSNE